MNTIYFTSGTKGGSGKTFSGFMLAFALERAGYNPTIIETDAAMADLGMAYKGKGLIVCDLREREGWEKMLTKLDEIQTSPILINSAANYTENITKYGEALSYFSDRLKLIWAINADDLAIELLEDFLSYVEGMHSVTFVMNGLYGPPEHFLEYAKGEITSSLNQRGIKNNSIYIPQLIEKVRRPMYNEPHQTLSEVISGLSFGEKLLLRGWEKKIIEGYSQIID